ncbi:hypothetical protein T484DRAFT_1757008 [Baffinella frigidus]|nr:hypothetical protein T484DRAFT_1757008 [Cryptophyta sp. CCMP2293]
MKLLVDGQPAAPAFMQFTREHYIPFCRDAIKAMFTYGFVPWHFRSIRSGDVVPEVLPAGTFTWSIIQNNATNKECDYGDDASKALLYDIKLIHAGHSTKRADIFIFEVTQPTWNISQGSQLRSCYPSPLSHVVADYKNMRTAMINRAHADAWNTQAHIITKQQSKTFQQDPQATFLEAGINPNNIFTYEKAQLQLHSRDNDIQEMFTKKATAHMPYLYTLPMDISLEPAPHLTPCEDIPFLDSRFKHEIAMLTGVPAELLTNRGVANESSQRTRTSTAQFHTSMDNIAQTIQRLLRDVYKRAYHGNTVDKEMAAYPMGIRSKSEGSESNARHGNDDENSNEEASGRRRISKKETTPSIQWFLEVAPPISLDTVDDLVKLASVEGALNAFEIRRVVQMLLYGKGTPGGGASKLCSGAKQATSGMPAESFISPPPPEKKSDNTKK